MLDPSTLLVIVATFLLAGTVKGVVGFGLPAVSVAVLTVALGLPQAMALMLVPAFVSNIWQSLAGGHGRIILRRIWPFLVMAVLTVWIGAEALSRVDLDLHSGLLGVLLVIYAAVSLAGLRLSVTPGQEIWMGPLVGAVNGVLTGMTGAFVVPGALYLQAIGLPRDLLVQAMGMLFLASTLALGIALGANDFLTVELGGLSVMALLPALAGMAIGQKIRSRLPEQLFRKIFLAALLLLGAYIIANAAHALSV